MVKFTLPLQIDRIVKTEETLSPDPRSTFPTLFHRTSHPDQGVGGLFGGLNGFIEESIAREVEELVRSERESVAAGRMHGKTPPSNPGSGHQRLSFAAIKIPEIKQKEAETKKGRNRNRVLS